MTSTPADAGRQAERTALAWVRTSFSMALCMVLLVAIAATTPTVATVAAALLACAATGILTVVGRIRRRHLLQRGATADARLYLTVAVLITAMAGSALPALLLVQG
ncbi:DUF202 domain-containing protein [Streptomyces viridochromogenes]|uniref:DUF202 domain-containing protein n=1 Tax=Streptomyces viridochromogenes Tue57 TaxID=1160705 RepID=L8PQD4_STRVR|nr:DUF202 domain-containing protein [Streptomyces viridochromogenes]ELS58223.1 hypothetical protein STVIR_0774 [Streptomyces viridochromogenes Tue57]